jgi:hypothetical protein
LKSELSGVVIHQILAKSIACVPGIGQEFDYSSPAFYLDLTRARGTRIRIERPSFDVPGSTQRNLIVKIESVIYEPPSREFPHFVLPLRRTVWTSNQWYRHDTRGNPSDEGKNFRCDRIHVTIGSASHGRVADRGHVRPTGRQEVVMAGADDDVILGRPRQTEAHLLFVPGVRLVAVVRGGGRARAGSGYGRSSARRDQRRSRMLGRRQLRQRAAEAGLGVARASRLGSGHCRYPLGG